MILSSLKRNHGVTLIEAVVYSVIFSIVGLGIVRVTHLITSSSNYNSDKQILGREAVRCIYQMSPKTGRRG